MAIQHADIVVSACQRWQDQFRQVPDLSVNTGYTMIVCASPIHGIETFYVSMGDFQSVIKTLLVPYWINNYTITLIPMG